MSAFKATYADWKLIKTRGVVQVVFEVPIQHEAEAYRVLGGMPDASAERWFAIAPLAGKEETVKLTSKRLVQQAAMACADPVFRKFLREILPEKSWPALEKEEDAANYVRMYCGVESRSEILPGTNAAAEWDRLYSKFLAWKAAA